MPTLTLRPATLPDVPTLRRWDDEPHVIASDPNDDWHWETALAQTPDWRESFIAEVDARPIGFLEIIDPSREDTRYWGDIAPGHRAIDIWIGEPDALGQGYGTQMMRLAITRCFADPSVHTILLDPLRENTRARRFYERLGFEFLEHRRFGPDACAVYHLRRTSHPQP